MKIFQTLVWLRTTSKLNWVISHAIEDGATKIREKQKESEAVFLCDLLSYFVIYSTTILEVK